MFSTNSQNLWDLNPRPFGPEPKSGALDHSAKLSHGALFNIFGTKETGASFTRSLFSLTFLANSQKPNSALSPDNNGEKKLTKVIVPDKWKAGASNTTEGGGRKINENKLLSKKNRWTPYGNTKCTICKQQVHQEAKYCHTCAYSKGVCAMCGKQVLDTKFYKQSNV
ncbi:hypothetical protein ACSBR2_016067 [Camellia fascicularis]